MAAPVEGPLDIVDLETLDPNAEDTPSPEDSPRLSNGRSHDSMTTGSLGGSAGRDDGDGRGGGGESGQGGGGGGGMNRISHGRSDLKLADPYPDRSILSSMDRRRVNSISCVKVGDTTFVEEVDIRGVEDESINHIFTGYYYSYIVWREVTARAHFTIPFHLEIKQMMLKWKRQWPTKGRRSDAFDDARVESTTASSSMSNSIDCKCPEQGRTNSQIGGTLSHGSNIANGAIELLSLLRILGEGYRLSCTYRCQVHFLDLNYLQLIHAGMTK
ncbi:hypothetical protein Taro_014926 [Colocasia esculenta]|uniref:Uncharacterized protein n=1 Tax=Colocasia esculenta TaxID=4460 RepID=A0A843UNB6_COLES|nr:hypothetical protein [Colocasia esculenta]